MTQKTSEHSWSRNLKGYGGAPPHPRWPGDARIAVSLVVNIEEGAEQAILSGDPVNESIYDQIAEVKDVPNLGMTCNFDYGPRAGYWRIVDLLDSYGATCTINACAQAFELAPWIAADCVSRSYEISSHGYRWEPHGWMSEEAERERIRLAVDVIRRVSGSRPLGWHTRGPCSVNTRRLVIEEGGFVYDSDTTEDDLPFLIDLGTREHVVLPYAQDTNDMHLQRSEGFRLGRHFAEYVIDAFDWLYREGATSPKMMTVGIHTRILGRPGRIGALDAILGHMTSRQGVWFAKRGEIAEHWLREFGKYR